MMKSTTYALACFMAQVVLGTSSVTNEVVIFSVENQHGETPLLLTIDEMTRHFDVGHEFPSSFYFPKSFSYEATYGQVTRSNKVERIFEGAQSAIFDAVHNRVRLERETRVFSEKDTVVRNYDFEKMRLLVSDPVKKMCL